MRQYLFGRYSWPLVTLGGLVAIACLASTVYINRLQEDLARTVRHDAAGVEAADVLQVQLRHLRFHSLLLVADHSADRRQQVETDLKNIDGALQQIQQTSTMPEDQQLAARIQDDYLQYKNDLRLEQLRASAESMRELLRWSDLHHMESLLNLCRDLADRQRERMNLSLEQSEGQTAWAGGVLLSLGLLGVLAGMGSGYITARTLSRRVAQLSVRVQAVHATLDQDVGAMTVESGDLDEQLDRVVARVSAVCKRLQEQERDLLRAEQLAAVGQLAAGVAHEIRNPLTGVKLLLQAAVQPQPTPLTAERLHLLLQEVGRIERTVQGLMDFARTPSTERQSMDLRDVITAAIEVTAPRTQLKGISIRTVPTAKPLMIAGDRDQLLSLLTNLLNNAIDAAPAGGEVMIAATPEEHKIRVEVSDTGAGIDPAIASRLFQPFATTKPTGTGLGLSIAQRIAREHDATLTGANDSRGGARFTLTLPALEPSHAETAGR